MKATAAPSSHPDYAARGLNPERLAAIQQYAGDEVLDVGCGNGAYVLHLADRLRIRGVDYRMFDAWAARPELFSVSDAQRLTLPDNAVDTILSFETLEHLPDPAKALAEYFRVCRQGLVLTVPNCDLTPGMRGSGVIFNHWIDRTHINFWDVDSIADLVAQSGFRIKLKAHINQINLSPFFAEALGLRDRRARLFGKLLKSLQRRTYPMTCLVVADKIPLGTA
jgi:SAM-dependent methyltransferase